MRQVHTGRFCALDFELDGLAKNAHLLQAGWVPFSGQIIALDGARSFDIRSNKQLDDTAVTIHGIGEERAAKGERLRVVVEHIIDALAGRLLVAHSAGIEQHALQRVVKQLFGVHLPLRLSCTLTLERTLNPRLVGNGPYRLGACRKRYGLPDYSAHDALTDAIAAAELFVAQTSHLPSDATLKTIEHG